MTGIVSPTVFDKLRSQPYEDQRLMVLVRVCLLLLVSIFSEQPADAQKNSAQPKKLPSAEKITDNYLKAIGGKKLIVSVKDATYEWIIELKGQTLGTARSQRKLPASVRWEMNFGNGRIISATSVSSAWEVGLDTQMRTLTGLDSVTAKL